MLFLEILHHAISLTNAWFTTTIYQPPRVYSMFYVSIHPNDAQHVILQTSAQSDYESLDGHESLGIDWNSILITWSVSVWSIFFKSLCATVLHQFILVISNHIYIGISVQKQLHNSIPYKNVRKQELFNTFWYIYHDTSNINLYGTILVWGYVYTLYLSILRARGAATAH